MIFMIVAMDNERAIGKGGAIPWKLPQDIRWFRDITIGHTVVMGRKTLESIGGALKGRENIVLSRNPVFSVSGCHVMRSVEGVLLCNCGGAEMFIIGGEQVYRQFMPYTDRIYITEIDHRFGGDRFFPSVLTSEWREIWREKGVKEDDNPYDYRHLIYERR
ncbi:MAG: Dihydrofolate reductase [candidate division WS2 bacterium]|uniref:Dihydrofolate reductase n=1 Tax=Psychracetigena formicireducens TaxID=2986056 RepID=A0A9E2BF85_PSYF1|nr:Dihydrofolate reductase [Candidatus Psychracetigena formicireducens]MBT9151278.1 Dihydrofolate reductase [Candidatus Psychracetigena formicireducens]